MAKYFGTDGIRGVFGETITPVMAYQVGQSLKSVFNCDTVYIGRDTRQSGETLHDSLAKGAMSQGMSVYDAGISSTPMMAHYSAKQSVLAIMITASHNPYLDNGIKLFNHGKKLTLDEELSIESFIDNALLDAVSQQGSHFKTDDITEHYMQLYGSFSFAKTPFKVAIDTAHGATYKIASAILSDYVESLVITGNQPNGENINFACGSTHLEAIQKLMISHPSCTLGFSFDGDGDRVIAVDQNGNVIDGDLMIYVIARYLKSLNRLNKNTVVLTVMSNPGIIKALNADKIDVILTDVGDKYVAETMRNHQLSLGGENSGHIILSDYLHSGDGVLSAVIFMQALMVLKMDLPGLLNTVKLMPQKMVNVYNVNGDVITHDAVLEVINTVKARFNHEGKVLLRKSGTEPVVRITLAYDNEVMLDEMMTLLKNAIENYGRDS